MTLSTVSSGHEKMVFRQRDRVRFNAPRGLANRGSDANGVIVPHQLRNGIRSEVCDGSAIVRELQNSSVGTCASLASRRQCLQVGERGRGGGVQFKHDDGVAAGI